MWILGHRMGKRSHRRIGYHVINQTTNIKRDVNGLATIPQRLESAGIKTAMDRTLWGQQLRTAQSKRHDWISWFTKV